MKVMYQGKKIELEEPEQGEKELQPISMYDDELDLRDTIEFTEDMLEEIKEKNGEDHD